MYCAVDDERLHHILIYSEVWAKFFETPVAFKYLASFPYCDFCQRQCFDDLLVLLIREWFQDRSSGWRLADSEAQ